MRVSTFFLVCCVFFSGCSARSLSRPEVERRASAQTAELERRYGMVNDRGAEAYVQGIIGRLLHNYPGELPPDLTTRVVILRTLKPIAVAPGNGAVIVSRGLLLNLNNEAELAFILGHELAHDILGHTAASDRSPENRRAFEIAADHFGLGLMAVAGYDPRPSVQALAQLQRMTDLWTTDPNYPDFVNRLAGLQSAIYASNWHPPGTIDRRDFHKLHGVLCSYPPGARGGVCG